MRILVALTVLLLTLSGTFAAQCSGKVKSCFVLHKLITWKFIYLFDKDSFFLA